MTEYHEYYPLGHIQAISLLLKNAANFATDKSEQLTKVDYSKYGEFADMVFGEDFHLSVYCDAAYSHLVASSLATFFESFFFHEFHNLRDEYEARRKEYEGRALKNSSFDRWKLISKDDFWNPKKVAYKLGKTKRDIVDGVQQLMEALEISIPIQPEKWLLIRTLFLYRNYVIHNGFEWRKAKLREFKSKVRNLKVDECFRSATSGNETWIIYMTKEFEFELVEFAFEIVHLFDLWFDERMNRFQHDADYLFNEDK
jgi:hypothetical protein